MPTRTPTDRSPATGIPDALARGRACYARDEWDDAFVALNEADREAPLEAEDLHRLTWAAGMTARDEEMLAFQERLYNRLLEGGRTLPAARAAFWLGFRLMGRGEFGRGGGWLARAQRLVETCGGDCAEAGYLLLPAGQRHLGAGEWTRAEQLGAQAVAIGERHQEADLMAFGRNVQGRALLLQGEVDRGLALMDEAMIAVISGELTPVVTGIIYCSAIATCHRVYVFDRVREWTAALNRWCVAHPQLVMFTGPCLVHRAEIFGLGGEWPEAVEECRRAVARCVHAPERDAAARAHYQQAEIHRLRGEFVEAEAAYREASRKGLEPQPGLALLRLATGDIEAAASAIRRVLQATPEALARTRYLPACVDILLAAGDLDGALAASDELKRAALAFRVDALDAIACHACASVRLAQGDAGAALEPARRSFDIWQQLDAPYLAARLRVLVAQACVALGDAEGAGLELDAARDVFLRLGARPDLDAAERIGVPLRSGREPAAGKSPLTERELQVLKLVASGKTNKAIARELDLSEKTVDRHVSNIFAKVNVSTRAAATAFAYERKLV